MQGIKYRVLVIDDDEARNNTYHLAFDSMFSVTITNDIPNLTKAVVSNYDILIIDVVLGKGANSNAFAYLKALEINTPTVIISGQWVNDGNPSQSILRVPEFSNIIKVVGWNELTSENFQKISEEIYVEFCKRKNLRRENKKDVCTILQISDPQFGGAVSSAAFNDDERISEYLKRNSLVPDLIVIAGDIADKGREIEYNEAEKWITNFASKLWGNYGILQNPKEKERILIVPGNHDYDLSISASDVYSFNFNAPEINTFDKKDDKDIEYKNQKLGFYNFSRFARNLYNNDIWLKYADCAIHYNDQFINWGLNIISLNSVYKINNQNCENRFDQFYCDYSKLTEIDLPVNRSIATAFSDLCNIMIVHNPPIHFKNDKDNGIKSWQKLQTIIEDNKINICLYGHTHDNLFPYLLRDNGGPYCRKLLCIPSPSLRLSSSAITEDSHRGFNIIELHKNDGIINSVIVRRFELINASIQEITDSEDSVFKIR